MDLSGTMLLVAWYATIGLALIAGYRLRAAKARDEVELLEDRIEELEIDMENVANRRFAEGKMFMGKKALKVLHDIRDRYDQDRGELCKWIEMQLELLVVDSDYET